MIIDAAIDLVKVLFVIGFVMNVAGLLTWVERKQSAVIQDRIGANRADIFGFRLIGLFHPIADGLKMMTKEDFVPPGGNRFLHTLAPFIAFFPPLLAFAIIPFGDVLHIGSRAIPLQVVDFNVGILYFFAVGGMGIYGVVLAGWSSNNKFSLMGGLRASAQLISYEITLGLAIIGILMVFNTLQLSEINRAQGELLFGFIPKWGVVVQPFAFLLFLTAAVAESKRIPFDLPESESEIIGYFTEYSGMKWGMFMFADFIETTMVAGIVTSLFFGGWQVPFLLADGFHIPGGFFFGLPHLLVVLLQVGSFVFKVVFFCWLLMTIRWTLPRFRYDQLMRLGWKYMLPLALINVLVTGVVIIAFQGL
ncbi:MAG: complex I subunit 1 family protein [bacterium]|nr:complex I subunit 1 family protein [bacterium]